MSLTYTIDHVGGSTESVAVEIPSDKAGMSLQRTSVDPKTGEVSSVYILPTGDPNAPATVTYRSALNQRGDKNLRRISVTLATWARVADSVSGEERISPINATISFNIPQDLQVETADLDDMLGNLFSFMYPSQSAGARATTWLAALNYGITQH